jgi:hypothetical protein
MSLRHVEYQNLGVGGRAQADRIFIGDGGAFTRRKR